MSETATPFDDPIDGREEIFRATYRVLHEDGYAALSIQRIADEAPQSKSTIYHHFDGKDALLLAFAEEFALVYLEEFLDAVGDGDALSSIERALDFVLLGETADGRSIDEIQPTGIDRVYLEMRSQAVHDPDYREQFEQLDTLVRERLAALVREGIEAGIFRDVDPAAVAAMLYICVEGALLLGSTAPDREWLAGARGEFDRYLDSIVREEYRRDE